MPISCSMLMELAAGGFVYFGTSPGEGWERDSDTSTCWNHYDPEDHTIDGRICGLDPTQLPWRDPNDSTSGGADPGAAGGGAGTQQHCAGSLPFGPVTISVSSTIFVVNLATTGSIGGVAGVTPPWVNFGAG